MNTIAICFNKEITHFRKVIKDGNLHYRIFYERTYWRGPFYVVVLIKE